RRTSIGIGSYARRIHPARTDNRRAAPAGLGSSAAPGMAEAPGAPLARGEFRDHFHVHLHDRHDDELRDALSGTDRVRLAAAIPAGNLYLALVIGVDQADQIPEHDPMPM